MWDSEKPSEMNIFPFYLEDPNYSPSSPQFCWCRHSCVFMTCFPPSKINNELIGLLITEVLVVFRVSLILHFLWYEIPPLLKSQKVWSIFWSLPSCHGEHIRSVSPPNCLWHMTINPHQTSDMTVSVTQVIDIRFVRCICNSLPCTPTSNHI